MTYDTQTRTSTTSPMLYPGSLFNSSNTTFPNNNNDKTFPNSNKEDLKMNEDSHSVPQDLTPKLERAMSKPKESITNGGISGTRVSLQKLLKSYQFSICTKTVLGTWQALNKYVLTLDRRQSDTWQALSKNVPLQSGPVQLPITQSKDRKASLEPRRTRRHTLQ